MATIELTQQERAVATMRAAGNNLTQIRLALNMHAHVISNTLTRTYRKLNIPARLSDSEKRALLKKAMEKHYADKA